MSHWEIIVVIASEKQLQLHRGTCILPSRLSNRSRPIGRILAFGALFWRCVSDCCMSILAATKHRYELIRTCIIWQDMPVLTSCLLSAVTHNEGWKLGTRRCNERTIAMLAISTLGVGSCRRRFYFVCHRGLQLPATSWGCIMGQIFRACLVEWLKIDHGIQVRFWLYCRLSPEEIYPSSA